MTTAASSCAWRTVVKSRPLCRRSSKRTQSAGASPSAAPTRMRFRASAGTCRAASWTTGRVSFSKQMAIAPEFSAR